MVGSAAHPRGTYVDPQSRPHALESITWHLLDAPMEAAPLELELELQTALQVEPLAAPTAGKKRQGGRDTIEEIEQGLPPSNGAGAVAIGKALLAGNMDGLTQSEGTDVNTLFSHRMAELRKQATRMARDTGCSIQLVVKPNDAFSNLTAQKKEFRTGYLNSFLAESYGPALPWSELDQTQHEIFEHVHKLAPNASKKELLKVAERLGYKEYAEEILDDEAAAKTAEAEREREARREAKRAENEAKEAGPTLARVKPASVVPVLTKSVVTADEQPVVFRIKDMASDLFFRDCSKPAWLVLDFPDGRSTAGRCIEDVYKGVSREVLRKKPNHPYNCLCALRDFLDNGYWRDLGLSDPRQFFTWLFGILQDTERYKQVRARLNTVASTGKCTKWSSTGTRHWDGTLFAIFIRLLWDYGGKHGSIEATQQAFEAATASRLFQPTWIDFSEPTFSRKGGSNVESLGGS